MTVALTLTLAVAVAVVVVGIFDLVVVVLVVVVVAVVVVVVVVVVYMLKYIYRIEKLLTYFTACSVLFICHQVYCHSSLHWPEIQLCEHSPSHTH